MNINIHSTTCDSPLFRCPVGLLDVALGSNQPDGKKVPSRDQICDSCLEANESPVTPQNEGFFGCPIFVKFPFSVFGRHFQIPAWGIPGRNANNQVIQEFGLKGPWIIDHSCAGNMRGQVGSIGNSANCDYLYTSNTLFGVHRKQPLHYFRGYWSWWWIETFRWPWLAITATNFSATTMQIKHISRKQWCFYGFPKVLSTEVSVRVCSRILQYIAHLPVVITSQLAVYFKTGRPQWKTPRSQLHWGKS